MRWRVAAGAGPKLDAVALVDHVSDAVLVEHYEAIRAGSKADGSGPQPELSRRGQQGALAEAGSRPDVRGFTGRTKKPFSDELTRSAIKIRKRPVKMRRTVDRLGVLITQEVEATRAVATIHPSSLHAGWVATEHGRGVQYLYVGGVVAHLVDLAVAQWLDVGIEGALAAGDKRERKARRARNR